MRSALKFLPKWEKRNSRLVGISTNMARSDGIFSGVRFVLVGFDSVSEGAYRLVLTQKGGVDLGMYEPSCTHLIVSGRVYDDPVCLVAWNEGKGKTVVTETWIENRLDLGILADPTRVLYRPVKDMNGIPGCQSLHICLTGYQKQERKDIMRMVYLMGARYSKPLIAKQKYELAKKVNIKLVNHRWIEDCLKAWEIRSIDNYTKSGYELEILEAQTKNLEEKTDDEMASNKKDSAFNAHTASLHTGPTVSVISATSSVSSNGTTISKLSYAGKLKRKSISPVEQSSSHSVNSWPEAAAESALKADCRNGEEHENDKMENCVDGLLSVLPQKRKASDEKPDEANVGWPNILEALYSKLFALFLKKINPPS